MTAQTIQRLLSLCDTVPPLLKGIDEAEFSRQPAPGKWSKKEILGHLIDSAANNHQRFVRGQFEDTPTIFYNQNEWVGRSRHSQFDTSQLIEFWTLYNRHLAMLVSLIPEGDLQKKCNTGKENHTLAWLFEDYVGHLEHHLEEIVENYRERVDLK